MSFRDWLSASAATATPATFATDGTALALTVAGVATVAVADPCELKSYAYREAAEERAAILEYEAGLSHEEAERRAGIFSVTD